MTESAFFVSSTLSCNGFRLSLVSGSAGTVPSSRESQFWRQSLAREMSLRNGDLRRQTPLLRLLKTTTFNLQEIPGKTELFVLIFLSNEYKFSAKDETIQEDSSAFNSVMKHQINVSQLWHVSVTFHEIFSKQIILSTPFLAHTRASSNSKVLNCKYFPSLS